MPHNLKSCIKEVD